MILIVSPLSQVVTMAEARRPSHAVSLLSPGMAFPSLPAIGDNHLRLTFNDIAEPTPGMIAADKALLLRLFAFADGWDGEAPMLVHCWAGISRAPGVAFALACRHNPQRSEREIAGGLRRAAPWVTPNPLLVALADRILGRNGRMIGAIEAIGRGVDAYEGTPFDLAI